MLKKAALFVNPHKDFASAIVPDITAMLADHAVEYRFFSFHDAACAAEYGVDGTASGGAEYGVAFSLGGDGTVLYAARTMSSFGVPVFPINMGTLGFIAAIPHDEWKPVFERFLAGSAEISKRLMLDVRIERNGAVIECGCCLNDAVVSASGIAKIIRLRVKTDDQRGELSLGRYRSDGLIAATPTGSTAYSAAAGGPIIDPEMEAIIITPICPFILSNRPLVLPSGAAVIINVEEEQRSGLLLTMDGQVTVPLVPGDRIIIRKAPYYASLIDTGRQSFYYALRTKLAWTG
ncbi:MAG: NAD(+)/NADH kinase [Treponema sp.]|jgi:NAD+ kinase|nr:NAD(+)/NADH kinase [Treponema sp.]